MSSWNDDYLRRHQDSAAHIQAGLRVRALINPATVEQNQKELLATLSLDSTTFEDGTRGLELSKDWSSPTEFREEYRGMAAKRWPKAQAFRSGKA